MKTNNVLIAIAGAAVVCTMHAIAQPLNSAESRALKEYTSPGELVSISATTGMDKAFTAIAEVSQKYTGKIIVDPERRSAPIGVDISGLQWRLALETICRRANLWYEEYPNYFQIISLGDQKGKETAAGTVSGSPDIQKEIANIKSREIKISAVFFDVSITKLDEVGINWSFMKSNKDVSINTSFAGADQVTSNIFQFQATPKISFANISAVAKVFSDYALGEILSSPQLIVRSGEVGRIQVGQDFSIKERDFSGNLLDKFYSTGTIINVRPQVITESGVNFIHLVVEVERSSLAPSSTSTIINKTKANTNVLLLDGEETIIGGLYDHEVSQTRSGIPLLKDLPWYVFGLRYLFGYNADQVVKKELIILLKAELVPTLQERVAQKIKEDGVFQRWEEGAQRRVDHVTGDRKDGN